MGLIMAGAAATIPTTTQLSASHENIDPQVAKFAAQILADPRFQKVAAAACDDQLYSDISNHIPLLKWGIDQIRAAYAEAQQYLETENRS